MLKLLFRAAREKRKNRKNPLLGVEGEKTVDKTILYWWLSGLALGYILNSIGVLASSCSFCWDIARVIPTIYSYSTGSNYPNEMFFVVIYYLLTSPIVFFVLIKKVMVKHPEKRLVKKKEVVVISVISMFSLYMSFFITGEMGGEGAVGTLGKLYRDVLFASISLSFVPIAVFIMTLFLVYTHFSVLFEKKENTDA